MADEQREGGPRLGAAAWGEIDCGGLGALVGRSGALQNIGVVCAVARCVGVLSLGRGVHVWGRATRQEVMRENSRSGAKKQNR